MRHEKEWYTCDRCGKYIKSVSQSLSQTPSIRKKYIKLADILTHKIFPKNYIGDDLKTVLPEVFSMDIIEYYDCEEKHYHLCGKCRKEFERWIKNG